MNELDSADNSKEPKHAIPAFTDLFLFSPGWEQTWDLLVMFFYLITLYYWAAAAPKAFTNFTSYFESLKSNSIEAVFLVVCDPTMNKL